METEEQSRYLDEMMWEIDQRAVLKYAREQGTNIQTEDFDFGF